MTPTYTFFGGSLCFLCGEVTYPGVPHPCPVPQCPQCGGPIEKPVKRNLKKHIKDMHS